MQISQNWHQDFSKNFLPGLISPFPTSDAILVSILGGGGAPCPPIGHFRVLCPPQRPQRPGFGTQPPPPESRPTTRFWGSTMTSITTLSKFKIFAFAQFRENRPSLYLIWVLCTMDSYGAKVWACSFKTRGRKNLIFF